MFKQTILVCMVAIFAYYAGTKGLTLGQVRDWFDKREITQTIGDVFNKTIGIVEREKIGEKTSGLIDSLKNE